MSLLEPDDPFCSLKKEEPQIIRWRRYSVFSCLILLHIRVSIFGFRLELLALGDRTIDRILLRYDGLTLGSLVTVCQVWGARIFNHECFVMFCLYRLHIICYLHQPALLFVLLLLPMLKILPQAQLPLQLQEALLFVVIGTTTASAMNYLWVKAGKADRHMWPKMLDIDIDTKKILEIFLFRVRITRDSETRQKSTGYNKMFS